MAFRCTACGEMIPMPGRMIADGDGALYHPSCFDALLYGQQIEDLDRDVVVIPLKGKGKVALAERNHTAPWE